jgi:hypothetical protein
VSRLWCAAVLLLGCSQGTAPDAEAFTPPAYVAGMAAVGAAGQVASSAGTGGQAEAEDGGSTALEGGSGGTAGEAVGGTGASVGGSPQLAGGGTGAGGQPTGGAGMLGGSGAPAGGAGGSGAGQGVGGSGGTRPGAGGSTSTAGGPAAGAGQGGSGELAAPHCDGVAGSLLWSKRLTIKATASEASSGFVSHGFTIRTSAPVPDCGALVSNSLKNGSTGAFAVQAHMIGTDACLMENAAAVGMFDLMLGGQVVAEDTIPAASTGWTATALCLRVGRNNWTGTLGDVDEAWELWGTP